MINRLIGVAMRAFAGVVGLAAYSIVLFIGAWPLLIFQILGENWHSHKVLVTLAIIPVGMFWAVYIYYLNKYKWWFEKLISIGEGIDRYAKRNIFINGIK